MDRQQATNFIVEEPVKQQECIKGQSRYPEEKSDIQAA
jgi:hypothetical protein